MSSNTPQPDPVPGAEHAPATAVDRSLGTDPGAGYERRDANIRTILWLALAVGITCALVFWIALSLENHFESLAKSNDPELSPLADLDQTPPGPQLQHSSFRDLAEFRATQEHALTSYAWINRKDGKVQIPVARAMELILESGLPIPKGPTQPQQDQASQQESPSASDQQNAPPPDQEIAPPDADAAPEQAPDRPQPENR